MRIWTEEQRLARSQGMKALWQDPAVRESRSLTARRGACCPDCGETDVTKFYRDSKGLRTNARCKECHKKDCSKKWHSKSSVEKMASRVSTKYGITPQEYRDLHTFQNGKCAICGEVPKTKRGLHLDHSHESGVVRGLLCHSCNVAIGNFKDSPALLQKAIDYLERK